MSYNESSILEILRSVRHDYLNDLQLLKANAALNRLDRVNQIIDDMVNKAINEAKLSNLRAPKFTLFLIGYNWKSRPFSLEVEVTAEAADWTRYDDKLHTLFLEIFSVLEEISDALSDNVVTITVTSNEISDIVSICYSGKINNQDLLNQYFIKLNQTYHLVEKYIHNDEAAISFHVADLLR